MTESRHFGFEGDIARGLWRAQSNWNVPWLDHHGKMTLPEQHVRVIRCVTVRIDDRVAIDFEEFIFAVHGDGGMASPNMFEINSFNSHDWDDSITHSTYNVSALNLMLNSDLKPGQFV